MFSDVVRVISRCLISDGCVLKNFGIIDIVEIMNESICRIWISWYKGIGMGTI